MRRIYQQKIAGFSGSILPDMVSWKKNNLTGGIRMDGQEKLLDYIRLILAGKSHEHIAIRKMLTFLVEIRGNK